MLRRPLPCSFVVVLVLALLPLASLSRAADLDGDGADELVFREHESAGKSLLVLAGGKTRRIVLAPVTESGQGVEVRLGDFDGDARAELLARNLVTGATTLRDFRDDGSVELRGIARLPADPRQLIEAVADFDGDQREDLLVRDRDSGERTLYRIRGASADLTRSGQLPIDAPATQRFIAASDFDGDGRADLLLRNEKTLAWVLRLLEGTAIRASLKLALPLNPVWGLEGTADMDGDGRLDLLFRRIDTGEWRLWFMTGAQARSISGLVELPRDAAWRLASLADLDGDGLTDVLLRHQGTGELYAAYLMQRWLRAGSGPIALGKDATRVVAGAGDFDGDGASEVLLRSETGGWQIAALASPTSPKLSRPDLGQADALTLACPPPDYPDFVLPPLVDPVGPDAALLGWNRPATRTNGEALCAHELAGFRISAWRKGSTSYREWDIPDPARRQRLLSGLSPGTWRFGVRAYDLSGHTGPLSTIRSKTL